MNILLVEPKFPTKTKSKNHCNFLPIGLLKLASYYRSNGHKIKLVRGNLDKKELKFRPDQIMVTSLFTYWSKYVRDCVQHYKGLYPKAKVVVGGIYASLMPEHCKEFTGCDGVFVGVNEKAEKHHPAYDLISNPHPIDYQIVHTSRGCIRRCDFCGTWKIEPKFTYKKGIKDEVCSNKIIFYDNNLLANPYIKDILDEIANTKYDGKSIICETQCGFDGELLTPEVAKLIKKAKFVNPRMAWDGHYSQHKQIEKQLNMLVEAEYNRKDIYIFMIYNWEQDFREMEKKRMKCWYWKVQVSDCRNRPLTQLHDHYRPMKDQSDGKDYYINPNWTDAEVKQFRKNVRRQNICVRNGFPYHSKLLENKKNFTKEQHRAFKTMPIEEVKKYLPDLWVPSKITPPNREKWVVEKVKMPSNPQFVDTIVSLTPPSSSRIGSRNVYACRTLRI